MPAVPVDAAVDVAGEDLRVRHQLVTEHDRLRRLQMGEAGRQRIDVLLRLRQQRVLQVEELRRQRARLVAQEELEIVRRLVVARAARAQLAAERAQPLDQHALDERVHIFVASPRAERAGGVTLRAIASSSPTMAAVSAASRMPARCNSRACACDDTMSYGASRK